MSPNFQRGLLLFQQSRFELAGDQLRQALAAEPHDAHAHALLALCLAHQEQFNAATDEARQAIVLAPDFSYAHYVMASILHDRRHYAEALTSIEEALRLDPEEPDYAAMLAQIRLDQGNWPAALDAAERGLQSDPEHVACTNLRAIALVKLGRRAEAGATIDAALARHPDNAVTHANQGWTLLERNQPHQALEHFREALRLDPGNEWARAGIVEALKARYFLYSLFLRYFLWMARLSPSVQWGVILAGYFGNQLLGAVARANPGLGPWIWPIRIPYLVFVVFTWTAQPLFDLLLRLNRFGRLALSEDQIRASNWLGLSVSLALLALGACLMTSFNGPFLSGLLVFGLLIIPVAATFKCPQGWPRQAMALYTSAMAVVGVLAFVFALLTAGDRSDATRPLRAAELFCLGAFLVGAIGSSWVANFLITRRPRR